MVVGVDESLTFNRPPSLAAPVTDVVVVLQAAGEKPPRGYRAVHPGVVWVHYFQVTTSPSNCR